MNSKNDIHIYTDGSCHTQFRVGAWAAIIINNETEEQLHGYEINTTHNRMELLAVINALKHADINISDLHNIKIYSDSQYVVRLIDRRDKLLQNNFLTKQGNDIKNKDLVIEILYLIDSLKPEFIKVKAHQKKSSIRNVNRDVDKKARKIVREYVQKNCTE